MITAEVSLYPLHTQATDELITSSLEALEQQGVHYDVGTLSTHISGDEHTVWSALQSLYQRSQSSGGEIAMVVTISNRS